MSNNKSYTQGELIDIVSLNDVRLNLYSNGNANNVSDTLEYDNKKEYLGIKYQCVTFVREYIYKQFDVNLASLYNNGDAKDWYINRTSMYLNEIKLKDVKIGDIMTMQGGKYGHVAIVSNTDSLNVYITSTNFMNDERDISFKISKDCINSKLTIDDANGNAFIFESFLRYSK